MARTKKMTCPGCASEMNHHADKIDYSAPAADANDLELGGVVSEVHSCPRCGVVAMRVAE